MTMFQYKLFFFFSYGCKWFECSMFSVLFLLHMTSGIRLLNFEKFVEKLWRSASLSKMGSINVKTKASTHWFHWTENMWTEKHRWKAVPKKRKAVQNMTSCADRYHQAFFLEHYYSVTSNLVIKKKKYCTGTRAQYWIKIVMWNFHRGQIFVQHGFTQASVVLYTTEEELEPLETNKQKNKSRK